MHLHALGKNRNDSRMTLDGNNNNISIFYSGYFKISTFGIDFTMHLFPQRRPYHTDVFFDKTILSASLIHENNSIRFTYKRKYNVYDP